MKNTHCQPGFQTEKPPARFSWQITEAVGSWRPPSAGRFVMGGACSYRNRLVLVLAIKNQDVKFNNKMVI